MDTSGVGIGTVLNQNQRPIAFVSRTLNKAERNYTVMELECLAMIWALNKFRTYFGVLPVKNVVADVLSRNPVDSVEGSQISCMSLRALALNSREQLIQEQREDPELGHIYRFFFLENPDDSSVNATVCEGWSQDFKWSELIPLRKASAQAIAKALFENYISRYGAPISLISDNGPQFIYVFEHLSHRWNSEKSRCSRKPLGKENKSCKLDERNAGLEDLRVKHRKAEESTGTVERDERKRIKICRERSFNGSDYEHNKIKAPVRPQGLKRGVASSISSRQRKNMNKNTNTHTSQEPEVIPGPSNQGQMRMFSPPKEESSRETRGESGRT
ncbi:hypothetical protein TNCV_3992581 [Trichonephila clavipes]|uniref:Reverse transcriptase RNase H-like domain-containing protein n=1 Tax=Trichonephila clavipes TaxID=2585209 RepID=A0A8X6VP81_TRICX|nr:hypothetical protein TNCV_3992581 [Trichonephila clavipes]